MGELVDNFCNLLDNWCNEKEKELKDKKHCLGSHKLNYKQTITGALKDIENYVDDIKK